MLKSLAFSILAVAGLVLALVGIVVLPFLLLGLVFKLLVALIVLPFRILGLAFGVLAAIGKALVTVIGVLSGIALFVLAVLFLPLLPVLLVGIGLWALFRLFRKRPAYVSAH